MQHNGLTPRTIRNNFSATFSPSPRILGMPSQSNQSTHRLELCLNITFINPGFRAPTAE